ncbi:MAG: hypothetical protein Q9214_005276 [Letrouitia sp. 1 TL-2023]
MAVAVALERMTGGEPSQTPNLHPFFTSRHGKGTLNLFAAEDGHQKKRRRIKSPDRIIFPAPKERGKSPEIQVNQIPSTERDDNQASGEVPKSYNSNQIGAKPAKRKKRTPIKQDDKEISLNRLPAIHRQKRRPQFNHMSRQNFPEVAVDLAVDLARTKHKTILL